MNNLIMDGYRRDLKTEDLWSLDTHELSEYLNEKFSTQWNKAANKLDIWRKIFYGLQLRKKIIFLKGFSKINRKKLTKPMKRLRQSIKFHKQTVKKLNW